MSMGGTSAAAPLWAGLTACLSEGLGLRIGYLTPLLEATRHAMAGCATSFAGTTRCRRQGYKARRGGDACTGLVLLTVRSFFDG